VIKFDNIFEEIKMIDSVLNFVNFLDDTDFFNAILEYILNLDVNRHMNTLFQYKDIQSHNTVFERYLSGVKIQSERERNLGIFREIQRKYTTKLEFLGVSTLHISNIKAKNKIIFKTEEFGIISYSAGLLYSVVDHVNDVNDKYLTLNDEYNKNIQCCNKGKKIDGVLYVSDMETFLSTLSYSKFDPERKDIDPNMKYMTFVGTSKQICDGIERFQLNSKKKSSYDTNSKMKIIRHP
jgi:hypothetical protein